MRGRPLVQHTTHELDEHGHHVATRTVTDPAWLDSDRILALALDGYEAGLCPGCGQPKDRAYHPDMDGWFDVDVIECAGCGALADGTPRNADHRHKLRLTDTRPADRPFPPRT